MLVPCVGDSDSAFPVADQWRALGVAKLDAMRTQLVSFVHSGGTCAGDFTSLICVPLSDSNQPCP